MLKEKLINRFLKYVKVDTQADANSKTFPSTPTQLQFANQLKEECESLGLTDVTMDTHGYVFATLPSTSEKQLPTIGFIAHMDTAPDFSGKNVKPQLVDCYKGGNLVLNESRQIILSPDQFPILNDFIGKELITTDGTTLLGADDKAGIASILTACEYLLTHPEIEHGPIRIGFTPDEEIGHGVDHFDVAAFGASFAYTIDGGTLGEIQSQSFNAAGAKVLFNGVSVHPGSAKDKMRNSILMAQEFQSLLPSDEVPEKTEGYEGFFLLHNLQGGIEQTTAEYLIRDHSKEGFEIRKQLMQDATSSLQKSYGTDAVSIEISDTYYNMKEIIDQHPHIMELANTALTTLDVTPNDEPIRGGTDGSRLSFMGLPCPNIFTGGYNFHGRFEFVVVEHFVLSCQTIIEIAKLAAQ